MLNSLVKDLVYSARGLARERSFVLTTVATLTVALTLVTVVFAVFNAYVLRPYAVRDPYSLYEIRWSARQGTSGSAGRTFRWSDYQELRARRDLFDDVISERNRSVPSDGPPVLVAFVSGNYFQGLGGRVLAGRALADFDARSPGGDPVAVLSHRAWTRPATESGVVGRTVRLSDQVFTIVGVMQEVSAPERHAARSLGSGHHAPGGHGRISSARNSPGSLPSLSACAPASRRNRSRRASSDMRRLAEQEGTVAQGVLPQATPAPLTAGWLPVCRVFCGIRLVLVAACKRLQRDARTPAASRDWHPSRSVPADGGWFVSC
jgi:hypothetical protein